MEKIKNICDMFTESEIDSLVELKDLNVIDMSFIKNLACLRLSIAYHHLFFDALLSIHCDLKVEKTIVDRDIIFNIVDSLNIECNLIHACFENGLMSCCGSGYIFDVLPENITEEMKNTYKNSMHILKNKDMYIAANKVS